MFKEFLRFLNRTNYYKNHHAKFGIDRKIVIYLNERKDLSVRDVLTDGPTLIIQILRF